MIRYHNFSISSCCHLHIIIFIASVTLLLLFPSKYLSSAFSGVPSRVPSRYDIICYEFCEKFRPNGSTGGPFPLICDNNTFPDYSVRKQCYDTCRRCSFVYCDQNEYIFTLDDEIEIDETDPYPPYINCPSTIIPEGRCKDRCDYQFCQSRPEGFLESFSFRCYNTSLFRTSWDTEICHRDCKKCSESNCGYGEFFCPAVNATVPVRPPPPPTEPVYEGGRCEQRCDKLRPPAKKGIREDGDGYTLHCYEEYKLTNRDELKECNADCKFCPLEVCNSMDDSHYVMSGHDKERYISFRCPDARPTPAPPRRKPGKYIASWTVIALIAVAIIGCITATTFYGRTGNRVEVVPEIQQQPQIEMSERESTGLNKASQKSSGLTQHMIAEGV